MERLLDFLRLAESKKWLFWIAFSILLICFLLYGLTFIDKHSFVYEGERYFTLFDDAMISMRYGHNLSEGFGLVWNPGGERVEGFSNPLWVLIMALAHLVTIPYPHTSLVIKLLALILLATNLFTVRKLISLFTDKPFFQLLAVFFTAFYFPLNNWALLGMEVGLIALLINLALIVVISNLQTDRFSNTPYLILGAATLVRVDAAVPLGALMLIMLFLDRDRAKQHLQWSLGSIAIFIGGQSLLRFLYYGAWIPTTAVLKLSGISTILRGSLGLRSFYDFVVLFNWVLFFLPFVIVPFRKEKSSRVLLMVVFFQIAYSIYVGGDSWEHIGGANRFIATVMPLFLIAFVLSLETLFETIKTQFNLKALAQFSLGLGVIGFSIFSLVNFNDIKLADGLQRWTFQKKLPFVEGEERAAQIGFAVRSVAEDDALVAVVTAGSTPYYSDLESIDLLGKNDPIVAAGPMHINSSLFHIGNFRPGHNKWDYDYSIGQLQPDILAQTWEEAEADFAPYADLYTLYYINGFPIYIRNDSGAIRWELLPEPYSK